ncbi:MAG: YhcB family protein [Pseudomonadota bacterium]
MSWIIGVLLVIVGAIIGFFVARFWLSSGSSGELENQVEQSQKQLADYQREVAEHFATANALVEQLADTQSKLQNYLNQSSELLQQHGVQNDLPFFSEDTMRQLRVANTVNKDYRSGQQTDTAEQAPRDYTEKRSGLFQQSDESPAKPDDEKTS